MSHLADEIARQMQAQKLGQVDVAQRSKISQSQISKWLSSAQVSISEDQITALASALSPEVHDQAALVRAHLLDERYGPGSDLVTVEITGTGDLKDKVRHRSKGERAVEYLSQERHSNRDLNDLLVDLARVLGADL